MTTHSAQQPHTERWLDEIGATWAFYPDLPIGRIDQAASLANQVRHVPLDADVVNRYTADMVRGDQFPPQLVTPHGDNYALLGGNHRHAAHIKAGHSTAPAYIVTAPAPVLLRIRVEDNRRHGLPTTTKERIDHGIALVDTGMTLTEAAAIVGIALPELTIARAIRHADQRATTLDVNQAFFKLARTVRYQLSTIDDDAVFGPLADLVARASIPMADVKRLVAAVKAVEPMEALRLVGAEEGDWEDRARDRDGKVRGGGQSARSKFDTAMATIRGLDAQDIHDTCPNDDVRAVLAQRIMDTARILHQAHELLTAPKAEKRLRSVG